MLETLDQPKKPLNKTAQQIQQLHTYRLHTTRTHTSLTTRLPARNRGQRLSLDVDVVLFLVQQRAAVVEDEHSGPGLADARAPAK